MTDFIHFAQPIQSIVPPWLKFADRATQADSTSNRVELCHFKQGLKGREQLRVMPGRDVITIHLCLGLSLYTARCIARS